MAGENKPQDEGPQVSGTSRGWLATFDSLQVVGYRWFWFSLLSSMAALNMQFLVRGWLVYELTGSPRALGLVAAAMGIALMLFAPLGGVVADRVDKRNLMVAAQSAGGLLALVIAILVSTGAIMLWHLVVASVLSGIIWAFSLPARQAIIPELVEKHRIMNAVAISSGAMHLSRVVFPALGGLLMSTLGVACAYYVVVVCYMAGVALLLRVPAASGAAVEANASMGFHLAEGIRYIRRSPILVALLLMTVVPILFGMPYQMLMPVFAEDVLDVGARGLGFLMAAVGLGALAGSLLVASLGDFRHKGLLLLGSALLFGVTLILFTQSANFYLSLLILLCVGVVNTAYLSVNNTLLQTNAEDQVRGRVMSIYVMTFGLNGVGVLLVGELAEHLDVSLGVAIGGGLVLLFTLAMALWRPILRKL
ncbi:MAG: MFS transporter [Dehalococcoidia bacterium]|nr:MFS transporter [Dehalococcoidia bacterium]